jgi:hypothetical protein
MADWKSEIPLVESFAQDCFFRALPDYLAETDESSMEFPFQEDFHRPSRNF